MLYLFIDILLSNSMLFLITINKHVIVNKQINKHIVGEWLGGKRTQMKIPPHYINCSLLIDTQKNSHYFTSQID